MQRASGAARDHPTTMTRVPRVAATAEKFRPRQKHRQTVRPAGHQTHRPARATRTHARTRARASTHAHAHTRSRTLARARARTRTLTHAHARSRTLTHAHARTHARSHAHAQARTLTRARAHARVPTHACSRARLHTWGCSRARARARAQRRTRKRRRGRGSRGAKLVSCASGLVAAPALRGHCFPAPWCPLCRPRGRRCFPRLGVGGGRAVQLEASPLRAGCFRTAWCCSKPLRCGRSVFVALGVV